MLTSARLSSCKAFRCGQPFEGLPGRPAPGVGGQHVAVLPAALALYRGIGSPTATIRRAMPMRPLCPVKSLPRPAAFAAPPPLLDRASAVNPNTWTWGLRAGLVVDASFRNGEQIGAGATELVAERDGVLEGDCDPAGLPDYDGVERGLSRCGQGEELVELVRAPGRVGIDCRDGELSVGAVFATGDFLGLLGNEAVPESGRVLDVDGSLGHGAEVQEMELGREPPAPASSPFVVCQTLAARIHDRVQRGIFAMGFCHQEPEQGG